MTLLRNIPWYVAFAALAVALAAILIGAGGMATDSIPACLLALKLLAVAGGLTAFAVAARLILEAVGVL